MEMRAAVIHIAVAAVIGALIAAFTPAKWMAASFWVSAAMLVNGAVAVIEDARAEQASETTDSNAPGGTGALAFKCFAASLVLAGLGFAVQFARLWPQ